MQNKKLNILIYPMLSVDCINSDSNYIIYRKIILELYKYCNFYLILNKNLQYTDDGLNKLCKIIWVDMPTAKRDSVVYFNPVLIRNIISRYPVDIIWNNTVEVGHLLKHIFSGVDVVTMPLIFNYHHYVIHESLGGAARYIPMTHIKLMQLIGTLHADLNYFHTRHCFQMLKDEAEKTLSDAAISEIDKNSVVILGSYIKQSEFVQQEKYEKFTFIYNHRLDGYKNWQDTFEIFDELAKKHDFQVIVTAGDALRSNVILDKKYVTVKSFTSHDDYLKEVSKCHANVTNSSHETFCIAIEESMLANHVIVAPNAVTFPELLGKDYKFLFNNKAQQLQMLDYILKNDVRAYKHELRTIENHAANILELFRNLDAKMRNILETIKDENKRKMIENKLNSTQSIAFVDFERFIRSLDLSDQSFSTIKIHRLLTQNNFSPSLYGIYSKLQLN